MPKGELLGRAPKNPTPPDPEVEIGANRKYTEFALRVTGLGAKINLKDAEAVRQRITEYFELCRDYDMKPAVSGMAVALQADRADLLKFKNETKGQTLPETQKVLQEAWRFMEFTWENLMQNGKINPASGIFLGKNHYGYRDVQEIEVTPKMPMGELADPNEIQKRLEGLD